MATIQWFLVCTYVRISYMCSTFFQVLAGHGSMYCTQHAGSKRVMLVRLLSILDYVVPCFYLVVSFRLRHNEYDVGSDSKAPTGWQEKDTEFAQGKGGRGGGCSAKDAGPKLEKSNCTHTEYDARAMQQGLCICSCFQYTSEADIKIFGHTVMALFGTDNFHTNPTPTAILPFDVAAAIWLQFLCRCSV